METLNPESDVDYDQRKIPAEHALDSPDLYSSTNDIQHIPQQFEHEKDHQQRMEKSSSDLRLSDDEESSLKVIT